MKPIFIGKRYKSAEFWMMGANVILCSTRKKLTEQGVSVQFCITDKRYEVCEASPARLAEKIANHYWNGMLHRFLIQE